VEGEGDRFPAELDDLTEVTVALSAVAAAPYSSLAMSNYVCVCVYVCMCVGIGVCVCVAVGVRKRSQLWQCDDVDHRCRSCHISSLPVYVSV